MATIAITKSYADGSILVEADLDNIKDDVETFLNVTGINDDNIQTGGITASSKLVDASISTAKLADSAVTTAKINNDAVTAAKIASTAVVGSVEHNGFVGEIRMFHTYNGAVSIPRGWMICQSEIINQTTYDTQHGSGAYDTDGIVNSPLLGKYLPSFFNRYPVGKFSTSQSGSSAITPVGNTSNQVDLSHTHTVDAHTHTGPSHIHQWYAYNGSTSNAHSFDNTGVADTITSGAVTSGTHIAAVSGSGTAVAESLYTASSGTGNTGSASPATNSAGSATTDIQPDSIEVVFIMKVV